MIILMVKLSFFQANGVVFVAGQIGLIPGSMVLAEGPENQARLGLRHLARVLEVFGCSTSDIVQVGRVSIAGSILPRAQLVRVIIFRFLFFFGASTPLAST